MLVRVVRGINMEIIYKNIKDIKEYDNNPRKNDNAIDYVARSISEFGFKVPIIVDAKNEIIAGHTRLKAAKKLGLNEVPVIVADDLTDEQIKAFRLIDNKTAEISEWDFEKLNSELSEITNFDMEDFGFLNTGLSDETIDEYFEDYQRNKEVKTITCPLCGGKFEV